ncbi:uncharacterized protein LOC106141157 [Amyelois transitella]|uniref:uncharacterized protein LOC106141157 n=1 Tax=Amyelois transitella TaxID=680683 RepID=UPI00299061C8|nr:uncharacterized protein LOC106141157 [Amyelois transitella]
MAEGRFFSLLLVACLLANALSAPSDVYRWRRGDNDVDSREDYNGRSVSTTTYSPAVEKFDDDDEDFSDNTTSPPSGSNIFSLLRLAGALLPGLSASNNPSSTSSETPSSPLWTLKMDILRAILQFGTSVLGMAFSSSSAAATTP